VAPTVLLSVTTTVLFSVAPTVLLSVATTVLFSVAPTVLLSVATTVLFSVAPTVLLSVATTVLFNVDTTKDPCQKVKCSRHKVCIAQGYQRAVCVNRKKLEHRLKQPSLSSPEGGCQPCPISSSVPVCGSDGHNYASQCKLEQQACFTGKELTMKCSVLDRSVVASCKDSLGWMFSKLDTNSDLYLDQAEIVAINLDKYEVCIRPFFNSCDSYRDGKVSMAEWCLCFWRESEYIVGRGVCFCEGVSVRECVSLFIPSCDEDGYYRKLQCDQARGECWCVDQHGGELASSRIHGNPDCVSSPDEAVTYSGDFGSGVGWEDEEDKEAEENEEEGEADDGGYIW
ncbi:unnamed protein product, partial [Coregonus sp. 'balchen']